MSPCTCLMHLEGAAWGWCGGWLASGACPPQPRSPHPHLEPVCMPNSPLLLCLWLVAGTPPGEQLPKGAAHQGQPYPTLPRLVTWHTGTCCLAHVILVWLTVGHQEREVRGVALPARDPHAQVKKRATHMCMVEKSIGHLDGTRKKTLHAKWHPPL